MPDDTNGAGDIFVRDRLAGTTEIVSVDDDGIEGTVGRAPSISADGRFITFHSDAATLAPGDTNTTDDVFVRDLGP